MTGRAQEDARRGSCLLHLVLFFVFLFIIVVDEVPILAGPGFLFFFVILFVQVIGDDIQMDGMRLRNLELGFTFRTTQELALFDFIFIDIDFGGTFRATDHGSILRRVVRGVAVKVRVRHRAAYYIPRGMKSTPVHGPAALDATASRPPGAFECPLPESTPKSRWLASAA